MSTLIKEDHFNKLSEGLLKRIFGYLLWDELCHISTVCKRFRTIADDNQLWDSLLALAMKETKHIHKFAEVSPVKVDPSRDGKYPSISINTENLQNLKNSSKHAAKAAKVKKGGKDKEKEKDNNNNNNNNTNEENTKSNKGSRVKRRGGVDKKTSPSPETLSKDDTHITDNNSNNNNKKNTGKAGLAASAYLHPYHLHNLKEHDKHLQRNVSAPHHHHHRHGSAKSSDDDDVGGESTSSSNSSSPSTSSSSLGSVALKLKKQACIDLILNERKRLGADGTRSTSIFLYVYTYINMHI